MKRLVALVLLGGVAAGCHHHRDDGWWEPTSTPAIPDGTSCEAVVGCTEGQIPVLEGPIGAEVCICRFSCTPRAENDAGACAEDRVCVQLEDEQGNRLPGEGSCEPVIAGTLGEPCAPEQCESGLICVGYTADTAYCRALCSDGTCAASYECAAVNDYDSPNGSACLPVTGTAAEGAECSPEDACAPGLFCAATTAGAICCPACDPHIPLCPTDADCAAVPDAQGQPIGYACVPRL
jgi:hypothetical protein